MMKLKKLVIATSIFAGLCGYHTAAISGTTVAEVPQMALPLNAAGWTDFSKLIVPSDGSRSLGSLGANYFNSTRDSGSKIVYFNPDSGDNESAEVYWWNGTNIIDSSGSTTNSEGLVYGTDPMHPNEAAIQAFADMSNTANDIRLKTHLTTAREMDPEQVAGGYPDWFLFKRGSKHTRFDTKLFGGRSEAEPMVVAAYGNNTDGRAVFDVGENLNPLRYIDRDRKTHWIHLHLFSIEFNEMGIGAYKFHEDMSANGEGPVTMVVEDCKINHVNGNAIGYLPAKSMVYRSVITNGWYEPGHNQGYYTSGESRAIIEDTIFYKNGYKEDPYLYANPRRDVFSRNIYQGGGQQMGHVYRNIISADGASGGPQMRYGGLLEKSLIIEGTFYAATNSNHDATTWMERDGQIGQSAVVRDNVQLIYQNGQKYNPEKPTSDLRSQPGWGFGLQGASFGSEIKGNIISSAMLHDELTDIGYAGPSKDKYYSYGDYAFRLVPEIYTSQSEDAVAKQFFMKDNTIEDNIFYRTRTTLLHSGDAKNVSNIVFRNNVGVNYDSIALDQVAISKYINPDYPRDPITSTDEVSVEHNRFYTRMKDRKLPFVKNNEVYRSIEFADAIKKAKEVEGWTDPDRTLKRYVTEKLGLQLLDWDDDKILPAEEIAKHRDAGEPYDPTGMKTFMAIATNMRFGGKKPVPSCGKPDMTGDYAWDSKFTAISVVNWIREGFGQSQLTDD
ncbi:hypothetical protein [Vibrio aerogenes]|nr:hypothetical protein [Vibrio aerogenes]